MKQILAWADSHHRRTGQWPQVLSGAIPDANGETWAAVNAALSVGLRGFGGSSSLAEVLAKHRRVRNPANLPPLHVSQLLRWADSHHRRTGKWPKSRGGPIAGTSGETWLGVDMALQHGNRGFPGGSSLARFLAEHRGVRNHQDLPRLSPRLILAWADDHHRRTGQWPTCRREPVASAPAENWRAVDLALWQGLRGLPGGSSLARLLAEHRGVPNRRDLPPLRAATILAWVDEHRRRTGEWPKRTSGAIPGTVGETWLTLDSAMANGRRGWSRRETLTQFLKQHGRSPSR